MADIAQHGLDEAMPALKDSNSTKGLTLGTIQYMF